jgi:hypothetical protein
MDIITVEQVETALGSSAAEWEGRCYEIACAMIARDVVKGIPRYGHWLGPIDPECMFADSIGLGFCQHGWVECSGNIIVDPTRWVFEGVEPYIYQAPDFDGWYDVGGNQFRSSLRRPCPEFDDSVRVFDFPEGALGVFIAAQLPGNQAKVSAQQVHWLATADPEFYGDWLQDVYDWITAIGCEAFVPIDNYKRVMED